VYFTVDNTRVSESSAILRYLPKRLEKPDLLGKNIQDQARVDQILGVIGDIQTAFSTAFREEGWEAKKTEVFEKVKVKIHLLEDFVQENYALGYLTVVDFRLADLVYAITHLLPDEAKDLKKLQNISKTVYELPQIKKYL